MSLPAVPLVTRRRFYKAAPVFLALALLAHQWLAPAYGAQLGNRALKMSSADASAVATYELSFSLTTPETLGSITAEFCSNDPLESDPCTVPAGLDLSGVTLSDQTGETGFTLDAGSTANKLVLSRSPAAATAGPVSYTFTGAVNPQAVGSYYVRLQTFAGSNASGPATDYGGIAFAINNSLSISAEVPPYLTFCAAVSIPALDCASAVGDYVDLGELSYKQANAGTSQMLTATNSGSGYTITLAGTTLSSGNNSIAALAATDVSRPGTAQFGLNLMANASPSVGLDPSGPGSGTPMPGYDLANFYRFVPGEVVAQSTAPDRYREYTVSYLVNVPSTQAPGVYVSTVTYICLANF